MNITNDALAKVHERIGDRDDVTFSDRAKQQIRESNAATDNTSSAAAFFPARHFTSEAFAAASQRLIDLREEIVDLVSDEEPDGEEARELLGTALHTLQDFYAHSNWVELGFRTINDDLGRRVMADPTAAQHPCPVDPNILVTDGSGGLTSGYTGLLTINCVDMPTGKCSHGNYPDEHPLLPYCPGINKDRPLVGENHFIAADLATAASEDYLEQIFSEIRGDDKAVAALLDARGSLVFVVDDTGSMGEEIEGVKSIIADIVGSVSEDPDLRPDNYILVRFGDPDVGAAFKTTEAPTLLAAVSALFPHGGGDCPELSQFGLLNAVNAAFPFSEVFLFTDASAKDEDVASSVLSVAEEKDCTLNYALTGSCSPIDPAYQRGAAETGGQLFFVNQFEIPKLSKLFQPQLSGDFERIFSLKGVLTGAAREGTFPVDATVRSLTIAVSKASGIAVSVFDAGGTELTPTTPGATLTTLTTGIIWTIDRPGVGDWRLRCSGTGNFDAAVSGNSPVAFAHFSFGEISAEMHGGFVRSVGQPVVGSNSTAEAIILGPAPTASFRLINDSGETILEPALVRGAPKVDPESFVGPVVLPGQPFLVVADGTTSSGSHFRREFLRHFAPQTLAIGIDGDGDREVSPGTQVILSFVVRNLSGSTTTLAFKATGDKPFALNVVPSGGTILGHDSLRVAVSVNVPGNASQGDVDQITFVATSTTDASASNSTQARVRVTANRPPDCSGLAAHLVTLWPANHKFERLDLGQIGGVTDPDGDAVSITVLGVTQDEPVLGAGEGDSSPDAVLEGGSIVEIRKERLGEGDGRVYRVAFQASDSRGGQCTDTLRVEVPHDQGTHSHEDAVVIQSTSGGVLGTNPVAQVPNWGVVSTPSPSRHMGTTIALSVGRHDPAETGTLTIRDLAGRTIRTWHLGTMQAGRVQFPWDERSATGRPVDPGVYFIHFVLGSHQFVRTHIVIR